MDDSYEILRDALGGDIERGIELPDGSIVWSTAQTVEVIQALRATKIAVHGGEFYRSEPIGLVPTYDGWHCTMAPGENATDFAVRSRELAVAQVTSGDHEGDHVVLKLGDQDTAA